MKTVSSEWHRCPDRIGQAIRDHIARRKVRYWGEPVGLVVAPTSEAAEAAPSLIDVEYEALPSVLHPRDAARERASLIHENLGDLHRDLGIRIIPDSNISHHYQLRRSDVDSAIAESHLVIENRWWVP